MRLALLVGIISSLSMVLMAADPFVGAWKVNLDKSGPRDEVLNIANETRTISQTGPISFVTIVDIVFKSGKTSHQEINRLVDGKEHFIPGYRIGVLVRTEISTRVDESTWKITQKRGGDVIGEHTLTISSDGKVMTDHRTFRSDQILIFEKQ